MRPLHPNVELSLAMSDALGTIFTVVLGAVAVAFIVYRAITWFRRWIG